MTISFVASATSTTNATSYTFSSLSIGSDTPGRVLLFTLAARRSGGSVGSISSPTIAGQAVSILQENGGSQNASAILGISLGTTGGTAADFSITYSNTLNSLGIGVFIIPDGLESGTPVDTDEVDASDPSVNLTVVAGGHVVFVSSAGSSPTWTANAGVTIAYQGSVESDVYHCGGYANIASDNASYLVDVDSGSGGTVRSSFVSMAASPQGQPIRKRHGGVPFMGGGPGKIGGGSVWMPERRLMLPGHDFKRAA